jgi:hypothetical protein
MASVQKRALVAAGALALALAAGATTVAGGQGGAGPPTGTLAFKVQVNLRPNHQGINPAVPRNKRRPKVADLMAGNGDLLSTDGQKIGIGHDFGVTTFEGAKKYKGKAIAIGTTAMDFGSGNFLFFHCIREDSPTNNSCAVVGGTGRYAGARGSAVEDTVHAVEDKKNKTLTFPVTVTFMP